MNFGGLVVLLLILLGLVGLNAALWFRLRRSRGSKDVSR